MLEPFVGKNSVREQGRVSVCVCVVEALNPPSTPLPQGRCCRRSRGQNGGIDEQSGETRHQEIAHEGEGRLEPVRACVRVWVGEWVCAGRGVNGGVGGGREVGRAPRGVEG